jgi:aryl-alcohol dehydrogenase-like predicted oxidoreductase
MAVSQVQYRLLHRKPQTDGVLDACRQMEVALVALPADRRRRHQVRNDPPI